MTLPDNVKERIDYVASYVQGSLTDWFLLKQEILRSMPAKMRKIVGLSKRHRNTKKMLINDVDREVIAYWELITGIKLWIDPKRLHDPSWVYRKRGWALNGNKERILEEEARRKEIRNSSSNY